MVEVMKVMGEDRSLELDGFMTSVADQMDATHETLSRWFTQIQTVFYKGFQRGQMPGFSQPGRLASFCNAAVTIMTHNLQSLCLLSVFSVTSSLCGAEPLLHDPASIALWAREPTSGGSRISGGLGDSSGCGGDGSSTGEGTTTDEGLGESVAEPEKPMVLKLHLLLTGKQVIFKPSFSEVKTSLLSLYDKMIELSLSVPRLETKLFAEWEGRQGNITPVVEEFVVDGLRKQVLKEISDSNVAPTHHSTHYQKYHALISGEAEEEVQEFMSGDHPFEAYVQKLTEFSLLRADILNSSQQVVELGPYEVHCEALVAALVSRVTNLRREMLLHLHRQYCATAETLCAELKEITERALSTPGDTLELMAHKSYMENVMENQLNTLETRVWRLHTQLQV
ncbi:putative dynein heavy chain 7, axonemal [Penaeus vannamei]|uniref:Putative dynein heavy chain 7, axonemal n=1 Tax=Penaeus vannamei TaxID=6689 RepID=A0A3R7MJV8_PENVA|nr:putative dynein heavy chain 7, axonemal [Penaeus vannamei]